MSGFIESVVEDAYRKLTRMDVPLACAVDRSPVAAARGAFGRDKSVISRHLRNVLASGELAPTVTLAKSATVQQEGERGCPRHRVLQSPAVDGSVCRSAASTRRQ